MAFQFVHMEVYSRKGRDGRGVDFVLAEAERHPDACLHVAAPTPPQTVFGVAVDEVRRLHDERAATATVVTKAGKSRRIRSDQNTLLTVVASHPATMEDVRTNPVAVRAIRDWEARTVGWLRDQYGSALVSVIRHVDEPHPHLHAYVLPKDSEMRAARFHPGQEAKAEIIAAGTVDGEDAKALNRRGDSGYRAAMRDWQDSYWQTVGLPCGLTRLGPGRRRLTRAEWKAEKTQADTVRKAREHVETLRAAGDSFVTKTRNDADATIRAAQAEAAELRADAIARQKEARLLHDAAETRFRKARTVLSRARRDGKRILQAARNEADRLRSFGSRIRFLWDGLKHSAIETRIHEAMAGKLETERKKAEAARRHADREGRLRRDAEQAREAAIAAAHVLGRERDVARRRLAALVPDTGQFIHDHTPGGRP